MACRDEDFLFYVNAISGYVDRYDRADSSLTLYPLR